MVVPETVVMDTVLELTSPSPSSSVDCFNFSDSWSLPAVVARHSSAKRFEDGGAVLICCCCFASFFSICIIDVSVVNVQ